MKKIVMLYGQNHKGSTYNIARMILEKIEGEKTVTEFFFPRDLSRVQIVEISIEHMSGKYVHEK